MSTFTLFYHFGSRTQLIREILKANARGVSPEPSDGMPSGTLEEYFSSLYLSWQWAQSPANLHRVRFEFEAGLLESVAREEFTATRIHFEQWVVAGAAALVCLGVEAKQAKVESRRSLGKLLSRFQHSREIAACERSRGVQEILLGTRE